ncbi:MAG TPA: LuxR C-terminal-related transcriptional regulator, partial [Candidatus Limnocylindria bacterium]
PDQRAIGLAVADLLGSQAGNRPVMVGLDDRQWLDQATAAVLAFGLRRMRLRRLPIAVLLTVRDPEPGQAKAGGDDGDALLDGLEPEKVMRLALPPLPFGAVHRLVKERLGVTLPRPALARIHEAAQGNPYYILELARALGEDAPATGDRFVRLPGSLEAALLERIQREKDDVLRVLEAASAMRAPTPDRLAAALPDLDVSSHLAVAREAGLIEAGHDRITFSHPLLASAVYGSISPEQRRGLHARLIESAADPVERARHRAAATEGPDADVASTLDEAAERELSRGAPAAGGELLELALSRTPLASATTAAERGLRAAEAYLTAGWLDRARPLLERLLASPVPEIIGARAECALASMARSVTEALDLVRRAAARPEITADLRAYLLSQEAAVLFSAGDVSEAIAVGRGAVSALAEAPTAGSARGVATATTIAAIETWTGQVTSGLLEGAIEAARRGGMFLPYLDNPVLVLALRRMYVDDLDVARGLMRDVLEEARALGDDGSVGGCSFHLAELEVRAGDLAAADLAANDALELAEGTGVDVQRGAPLFTAALADAWLGRADRARARAEEGVRVARDGGDWVMETQNRAVLGILDLSLGRQEAARDVLRDLPRDLLRRGVREPSVFPVWPNAIEALARTGDLDEARALLEQFTALADEFGCPWALATATRCAGLVAAADGQLDEAEGLLRGALPMHDLQGNPLERARTLLALGTLLRRVKRRREARAVLAEAEDTFSAAAADLWRRRVQKEAARIAGRQPAGATLSATELQVARLVAAGHTNREVAAALFVTERTVEANLSRIYQKLKLRSRTELARHLARSPNLS